MKRTKWGLSAMALSLLLGAILSLGSLVATRGHLDTEVLIRQPLNILTILVTCLDPLAILLEIAALVLIVSEGRQFRPPHRRLAWAAVVLYILWAAANLFGFMPLWLMSTRNGSLSLALTGQWIKALSALLAFAVPALLVYGLCPTALRVGLGLGWLLSAIGGFGSVALYIRHLQLVPVQAAGQTLHVARLQIDYTSGLYPALLTLSHVGGLLYLVIYLYLVRKLWLHGRQA